MRPDCQCGNLFICKHSHLYRIQFVWWFPEWQGVFWKTWDRSHVGRFFTGSLVFGFMEFRIWKKGERP